LSSGVSDKKGETNMRVIVMAIALLTIPATAVATHKLERETLAPDDGWAASGAGTTGGSLATDDQVYTVTTRAEFIAALNNGVPSMTSPSNPSNVPKIIRVQGTIDFNVDDDNQPLACEDYFRRDPPNGELFSYEAFEAAFDPNGPWGRVNPSGPQERARAASAAAQQARVRIRPGSNTTIVGVGDDATLKGIWMDIRGTANVANSRTNIIVRNLNFVDTHDCFPQWAPNDGTLGAWNALYDSISLRDTNNVWIDHNRFEDVETADDLLPDRFGVLFQVHDGLLDVTNASDLVTVSWNVFRNHDKVMLIGSSDNAPADVGKLRVTLHHNLFDALGQRVPRVRFGQVHIYNNYYKICATPTYGYSWGVGIQSQIYAEENFFLIDTTAIALARIISRFNGTNIHGAGSLVAFVPRARPFRLPRYLDLVAEYNAVNDPDLVPTVAWAPSLYRNLHNAHAVPLRVTLLAGTSFSPDSLGCR
jgi:pectate lyase